MSMDKHSRHIAEQAATYFVQRRGETESERQEREAWLAADARHARAYEETQRLWDRAGGLQRDAQLQSLKAADLAALQRSRWPSSGPLMWLAAAALALLLGGAYLAVRSTNTSPSMIYTTKVGERRAEMLEDGTKVVLNTDSSVVTHYTRSRRAVELVRGEAQFEVTHDAKRPFVVSFGDGTVTALGTRFQVRRDPEAAVVTLLQGSVEVAQGRERERVLRPNEQAHLSTHGGIAVQAIDPALVAGWLDGWLRFRNAPLREVVAEVNRYSARKLRLGDARLASLELSGNFHAGDVGSIASTIEQVLPVRVAEEGTEIVLRAK